MDIYFGSASYDHAFCHEGLSACILCATRHTATMEESEGEP